MDMITTAQRAARTSGGLARQALAILMIGTLAACSSGVKLDDNAGAPVEDRTGTAVARGGAAGGAGGAAGGASSQGQNDGRTVARVEVGQATDPLNDPKSPLSLRSIYFDFDSFVVTDKFRPMVEAHAKYLATNKGRKVVIQGNADERGGSEYNLALGQKRAAAVRRAIQVMGVAETQM